MNCCKNFCTFASTTVEYMQVNTVSELIYWSYANLAMAHSALKDVSTHTIGILL